jgi:transketolase
VGIAEQNLVGVATGLALEGFRTFAYAIAPFITMRAYEQIRNSLALLCVHRELNVNLVGVGAGVGYDVSGPTHHCLEDLSVMRTLPNIQICSPSDAVTARKFLDYALGVNRPKYLRLDSKPLPTLYGSGEDLDFGKGFHEFRKGSGLCIVATGYMTHTALGAAAVLAADGLAPGVIDLFMLRPLDEAALFAALRGYDCVVTAEEGFVNKGGLDGLVSSILQNGGSRARFARIGFGDAFVYSLGDRRHLHAISGIDEDGMIGTIREMLRG